MGTVLDEQIARKTRQLLSETDKQAIIAACATGARKGDIAKDFGIRPETVSRLLKDVKQVQNKSNPLSSEYKPRLRDHAIRAIERGLQAKRDPYAAANIAVKVMSGIGEFVSGSHLQVDGAVAFQVSWGPVQPREHALPQDVVSEARNVTPSDVIDAQVIDNKD